MSRSRFPSQPDELLRRWSTQGVPVEEPGRVAERREVVVDALARAIRDSAEQQRKRVRRRRAIGLLLAAGVALGLGLSAHVHATRLLASENETTVAQLQGAVVLTESGESRVLARGSRLPLHAVGEIETAPDAQAEIRSQKSVVHLSAATKLTVPPATSTEERFRLALGRVDVAVDKSSRLSRSVVVETPNAEVVVHGTVFAVGVAQGPAHPTTEVSVTRGSVWVLVAGTQVAVLGPGQRWSSEAGAAPEVTQATAKDTQPAPGALPAGSVEAKPNLERFKHTARGAAAEAKASNLAEQNRLFQEALDARNRGDDAHAAGLFARLAARYPGYEEAEVELFRAQKRLGQMASAAAGARRYLASHPQGFAREEARTLALNAAPPQPR